MKKLLPVFLLSMIGILAACSASTQNNSKQSQESATLPVTLTPVTHNQRGTQIVIQPRQSTITSKQVRTETPESKNTPARISTATSPSSLTSTPLTAPTLGPDDWESLPVIPQISPNAVKIYQDGVSLGKHPSLVPGRFRSRSKILPFGRKPGIGCGYRGIPRFLRAHQPGSQIRF